MLVPTNIIILSFSPNNFNPILWVYSLYLTILVYARKDKTIINSQDCFALLLKFGAHISRQLSVILQLFLLNDFAQSLIDSPRYH